MPGFCYQPQQYSKLNAHCRTALSLLDENGVHSMGQSCPVCPLTLNEDPQ